MVTVSNCNIYEAYFRFAMHSKSSHFDIPCERKIRRRKYTYIQTYTSKICQQHPECLPIAVNLRDSFYGPLGVRCLEFLRSGPAPKEDCEFGPREQLSQVTSYLDASMVYSSNAMTSDNLRIFRNGESDSFDEEEKRGKRKNSLRSLSV